MPVGRLSSHTDVHHEDLQANINLSREKNPDILGKPESTFCCTMLLHSDWTIQYTNFSVVEKLQLPSSFNNSDGHYILPFNIILYFTN